MGKVRIVTDSTADIPPEIRERHGINMVPLKVLFGEETFQDAVTITPDQFYEKLTRVTALPTTSQPSPAEFSDVYERLLAEDADSPIISLHLSAALSGTYQSAFIARSMLENEADITIIDTKSASYGFGMRVVKAAVMAEAGESKERIIEEMERLERDTELYFLWTRWNICKREAELGRLLH